VDPESVEVQGDDGGMVEDDLDAVDGNTDIVTEDDVEEEASGDYWEPAQDDAVMPGDTNAPVTISTEVVSDTEVAGDEAVLEDDEDDDEDGDDEDNGDEDDTDEDGAGQEGEDAGDESDAEDGAEDADYREADDGGFQCLHCDRTYKTERGVIRHIEVKH